MTQTETDSTRPLGHSGIPVSIVGLGCNNFGRRLDLPATRAVVDAALEHGINFLDTADIYGSGHSEEFLGEVLKGRRDEVVLASKFGMDMGDGRGPRGSRDYIMHAIEASLKRLQTDVIDVYWYHQPDGQTPIEETLSALHELVQDGRVRTIGASNFTAQQIEEADRVAHEQAITRFTAIQNEYSLLKRDAEADVLPVCERLELAFIPYFPLALGLLTGKYRRDEPGPAGSRLAGREQVASEQQFDLVADLERYAAERRVTLVDVAIGALLWRSSAVASVIAGATRPEQVSANASAGTWRPTDADRRALDEVLAAHPG